MYRKRRLWAPSYLSMAFFLVCEVTRGAKASTPTYTLNFTSTAVTIVDLVVHYENCIVRLLENEAHDDRNANQKLPSSITEYKAIEEHAAKVFTPANFYILQDDLK